MFKFQNIFLVGPMGAGKTTIGTFLARELKKTFYDSDQVVERRTGVDITWIFDVEGEAGFRKREIEAIDEITQERDIVLATGGGAILAAENRRNLSARGLVIYLATSLEQQMVRVEHDRKRPLIQKGDRRSVLEELQVEREPLYEEIADLKFHTDDRNVRAVASEIVDYIHKQSQVGTL